VHVKRRLGPLLNVPLVNALRGVPRPDVTGEAAQEAIARMVEEGGRLVARVGETEGRAASFYLRRRRGVSAAAPPYEELNRARLRHLAGFFPTTDDSVDRLAALYVSSIAAIDIYASWTPHDRLLCPRQTLKCRLVDIEPFFTVRRWPLAWAGKRVTVVSPFKTTILAQWQRRGELFRVPTLGECEFAVVEAPQTMCETDVTGQDWFENLDRLDGMVADTAPDVVVIGAGAYGLPVGARAKARGATAVVMGGSTQLLFGVMGNRWAIQPAYTKLQTQAWTRPSPLERPKGYQSFETAGGAYW
jgi:hypothetical protein